jgi:hypothetical protein
LLAISKSQALKLGDVNRAPNATKARGHPPIGARKVGLGNRPASYNNCCMQHQRSKWELTRKVTSIFKA